MVSKQIYSKKVFHLVQPYFFAHHHFHRRKIKSLRRAGINAWIIACVPDVLYHRHKHRYQIATSTGYIKILRIADNSMVARKIFLFLAKECLLSKRILVHVLRVNPIPIIRFCRFPFLGSKLRYVIEYEGDTPSEFLYQEAYIENPRPPEIPPSSLRRTYQEMLDKQTLFATQADGLILMSKEHVALWESRLSNSINACILPTLADPERIRFDANDRVKTRNELGLANRFVFIYTGNVIVKWQRLNAMCRFLAQLTQFFPDLWFLALVRVDDIPLAQKSLEDYGIADRSTLTYIDAADISRYYSAADMGLFLRHQHIMNKVVTSGKLGEYLAAGLPVITTGANTETLNDLIRELDAGLFLPDSLPVNEQVANAIKKLRKKNEDDSAREFISKSTTERFTGTKDPFREYVPFIKNILN